MGDAHELMKAPVLVDQQHARGRGRKAEIDHGESIALADPFGMQFERGPGALHERFPLRRRRLHGRSCGTRRGRRCNHRNAAHLEETAARNMRTHDHVGPNILCIQSRGSHATTQPANRDRIAGLVVQYRPAALMLSS